ncbi:hypothetical protein AVEN_269464-1 [Araneus ventricosus]|uniref:Uncharacterized protein n=1 Tax=Araneus ventricosus TaxID=182803 RepID=A0A4Y2LMG4_ARAVE|nr:hypothetical protein AVEN_269464-1 [Araneus ventricosus]
MHRVLHILFHRNRRPRNAPLKESKMMDAVRSGLVARCSRTSKPKRPLGARGVQRCVVLHYHTVALQLLLQHLALAFCEDFTVPLLCVEPQIPLEN